MSDSAATKMPWTPPFTVCRDEDGAFVGRDANSVDATATFLSRELVQHLVDLLNATPPAAADWMRALAERIITDDRGALRVHEDAVTHTAALIAQHAPTPSADPAAGTFNEGVEAAAKLMGEITGEGIQRSAPGHCARGWLIAGDKCPKCGATSRQNCPGDIFDAEKVADAIRALTRPSPEGEKEEMSHKPYKGEIKNWFRLPCNHGLGYYIIGDFLNHPDFGAKNTSTSWVEKHDAATGEIETRNSRYRLVGPEITP